MLAPGYGRKGGTHDASLLDPSCLHPRSPCGADQEAGEPSPSLREAGGEPRRPAPLSTSASESTISWASSRPPMRRPPPPSASLPPRLATSRLCAVGGPNGSTATSMLLWTRFVVLGRSHSAPARPRHRAAEQAGSDRSAPLLLTPPFAWPLLPARPTYLLDGRSITCYTERERACARPVDASICSSTEGSTPLGRRVATVLPPPSDAGLCLVTRTAGSERRNRPRR